MWMEIDRFVAGIEPNLSHFATSTNWVTKTEVKMMKRVKRGHQTHVAEGKHAEGDRLSALT
jgi:hypothetical protein